MAHDMPEFWMSHVACLIVDIAMFQENVVATPSKVRGFLSEFDRAAFCRILTVEFTRSCREENYILIIVLMMFCSLYLPYVSRPCHDRNEIENLMQ